jgi:hypothetical protein
MGEENSVAHLPYATESQNYVAHMPTEVHLSMAHIGICVTES